MAEVAFLHTLSTVSTLDNLALGAGTLSPGFATGTFSYTASVTNAVSSLTLTPTLTETGATVKVNGTAVTSGSASVPLAVGSNTVTIVVTSEDATTTTPPRPPTTYTVTVTRAATVPNAPTVISATAHNASATVTFTAPASTGGAAITGYTVTSNPVGGTDSSAGSTSLSHTVTGLANGTAYTFIVTASNSAGTGPASSASNSVTPVTAPGAPGIGAATAHNASATVTFTAPASTGGAAITGYTVTSNPVGGTDSSAGSTSLSHAVTGLANGTSYTFIVTATNSAGPGPASSASNSVTPVTVPGAPGIGAATAADNASATVTFTAPASTGGAAITGYTVTSNPVGGTDSSAGSTSLSRNITGLTNGTAYTFTVTATNSAGPGPASSASNSVTTLSNNAQLSYLALSSGELVPAFDPTRFDYTASVGNDVATITVSRRFAGSAATLSTTIPLSVGANEFIELVTAQDGVTTTTYTVTVTRAAALSDYGAWIDGFQNLADQTDTGDPDKDGIPNLLEYVLNGDPGASSVAILPTVTKTEDSFIFSFSRLEASKVDTTQSFQYSTDLSEWTDVSVTSPGSAVALGTVIDGAETVTVTIPVVQGDSRMFGRLKVTHP